MDPSAGHGGFVMKFDFKNSGSAWLVIPLMVVIATANDVVAGISGLYTFAMTLHGQAVLQVCLVIAVGFLLLRSFVASR